MFEMKNINTLLFDIGNVFIFADHDITYKHLIEKYKVSKKSASRFYEINEYIAFSEGEITGDEFAEAVRNAINNPKLTTKQIRYSHDIHLVEPIEEAISVLNALYQGRKYQLAFITNTNVWQNEKIDKLFDFSRYSDIIIRSNEEGITKRNPKIFKKVLHKIGAKNVLFIDDSLDNIKTANSVGIQSLHVAKNTPNLFDNLKSVGISVNT